MSEEKVNISIHYEGCEEKQKEWDYIVKFAELIEHSKIKELREIIIDILEPEQRYLTST